MRFEIDGLCVLTRGVVRDQTAQMECSFNGAIGLERADAILASDKTGFVEYSDYSSYFPS